MRPSSRAPGQTSQFWNDFPQTALVATCPPRPAIQFQKTLCYQRDRPGGGACHCKPESIWWRVVIRRVHCRRAQAACDPFV